MVFTVSTVYATLRARDSVLQRWYAVSLLALLLDMANHMWEATIAGVLVALWLLDGDTIRAAGVVSVTAFATVGITLLSDLQPAF